jgi:hypothetical protein
VCENIVERKLFAKSRCFPAMFLQLLPEQRQSVVQSDYVANLLVVHDQVQFFLQLGEILQALERTLKSAWRRKLVPCVRQSHSVPLRVREGWVEKRYGMKTVLLRIDFIGQAAAVKLQADELEPT